MDSGYSGESFSKAASGIDEYRRKQLLPLAQSAWKASSPSLKGLQGLGPSKTAPEKLKTR